MSLPPSNMSGDGLNIPESPFASQPEYPSQPQYPSHPQYPSQPQYVPTAPAQKNKRRWVVPTVVGVVLFLLGVGIGASDPDPALVEKNTALSTEIDTLKGERDTARNDLEAALKATEDAEKVAAQAVADAEKAAENAAQKEPEAVPEPTEEAKPTAEATKTEAEPEAKPSTPDEVKEDALSLGQKNAIGKAEDYLEYGAFSRSGLIEQLKFEGFSTKESTFAVDHVSPDWKVQAAAKAQEYLDYGDFSRQGLIDQLKFEGFSAAEAKHGASAVGY